MTIPRTPSSRALFFAAFVVRSVGRTAGFAALCGLLAVSSAANAQEPKLASLFPQQARIELPAEAEVDASSAMVGAGVLVLSPQVLSRSKADLSDLRVVAGDGSEVPYLVDGGYSDRMELFEVRTETVQLRGLERDRTAREGLPPRVEVVYTLAPPRRAPASEGGPWQLVVESEERELVLRGRLEVQGLGIGEADGSSREVSLFRLQDPLRQQLKVPAPGAEAGSAVVLTVWGEEGDYPQLNFRWQQVTERATRTSGRLELEVVERTRDGSRTILEFSRPPGVVPDALVISTSTGTFSRLVEVWDQGPDAATEPLARQTIFRLPALSVREVLEIPLAPARSQRLRVVVEDGDSPALKNLVFEAVVRRPALVFPLDLAGPEATLLFGGGRAHRPHYGLAQLAQTLPGGAGSGSDPRQQALAAVAGRLYDPSSLVEARLGEITENPAFDATPALAFAQRAGAALSPSPFQWRRTVAAEPSDEGLNRLVLEPVDVARARPDFGDVRLRDADGNQWPYLLASAAEERSLGINPERQEGGLTAEPGVTRLNLPLAAAPAPVARVELEVFTPFFDRAYRLNGREPGGDLRTLKSGRLQRRADDSRPVVLSLPGAPRLEELVLEIEDGDDAPLDIHRGTLALPVPALYFAAPASNFDLLFGAPSVEAPSYELERARAMVLAVKAGTPKVGGLEENPDHSALSRWFSGAGLQTTALWLGLLLAVVILGVLTLRMVRTPEGSDNAT